MLADTNSTLSHQTITAWDHFYFFPFCFCAAFSLPSYLKSLDRSHLSIKWSLNKVYYSAAQNREERSSLIIITEYARICFILQWSFFFATLTQRYNFTGSTCLQRNAAENLCVCKRSLHNLEEHLQGLWCWWSAFYLPYLILFACVPEGTNGHRPFSLNSWKWLLHCNQNTFPSILMQNLSKLSLSSSCNGIENVICVFWLQWN